MGDSAHPRLEKLRRAILTNIDYVNNLCDVQYLDSFGSKRTGIPLTQPYVGRGWGILVGVEDGTQVIVGEEHDGFPRILAYLHHPLFLRDDLALIDEADIDERPYRKLASGEVVLQSKTDSAIIINEVGDISLETPEGNIIEISRDTDTLFERTAQRWIECEAGRFISGSVKRDIRTQEERDVDLLTGTGSTNFDIYAQFIGVDPEYKTQMVDDDDSVVQDLITKGVDEKNRPLGKKVTDEVVPGLIDLRAGATGAFNNISDSANPSVTEMQYEVFEYADTNVGLDDVETTTRQKGVGKLPANTIARFVVGTKVNDLGKTLRFDYGFDKGQMGHGTIWKKSTDGFFDINNTLKTPQASRRDQYEWTVARLSQIDTAVVFDMCLHTRGGNSQGKQEDNDYRGSLWQLQIDKQGFTKLNIPAAKDLKGGEPQREGRSLLMNTDGSIEMSVGTQLCTDKLGLDRITGVNGNSAEFVCLNTFPNYGRKDRSLTLDLAGNAEILIGRDNNAYQSLMVECDGSLSFFIGKEIAPAIATADTKPITSACLAGDRKDRSITGRTSGNIELHIEKDVAKGQSLMITTEGGNRYMFGKDTEDRSVDLHTTGGINIEIQNPMKTGSFALKVDGTGALHVFMTGAVHIHSDTDMTLDSAQNMYLSSAQNMYLSAAQNMYLGAGQLMALRAAVFSIISDNFQCSTQGGLFIKTTGSMGLETTQKLSLTTGTDFAVRSSGSVGLSAGGSINESASSIDHNGAAPVQPDTFPPPIEDVE